MREDWIIRDLIDSCTIHDNLRKPINSKTRQERIIGKKQSELYPYYGATGQVGYIDDYLTDGEYVLVGEDGAPFLDYKKNTAYLIDGKTWVNNHAHILCSNFNNKFLLYYLNQFNFKEYVSGTTRLKLTQGAMKKIPILIAPLPEQRAIVAKIEQLFSDLDNGIASLKTAQDQLKVYRQAVLKKAFEGELTKEWRDKQSDLPTAEELLVQIKEERAVHYQKQMEDWELAVREGEENGKEGQKPGQPKKRKDFSDLNEEFIENLTTLPEGWNWIRIADIGNVGTGATPKRGNNRYWENGDIPWITSGALNNHFIRNCNEFVTQAALDETNIKIFPKHTLLLAMYGEGKTRGKCSEILIDTTTNQALAGIVQVGVEEKTRQYLRNFLLKNYQDIRRKSSGGVQPNINLDIVKRTLVPLCSIEEQNQIVHEIESRLSVCDKVEETIKDSLKKAEALRQSILKKAFEGRLLSKAELAACREEADWEPAEVLLERIKRAKNE